MIITQREIIQIIIKEIMTDISLLCTKSYKAYWGDILTKGLYYSGSYFDKKVTIITDYVTYYDKIRLVSMSAFWVKRGYTDQNLLDVLPGFIPYNEIIRLYSKDVFMPYLSIQTKDDIYGVIDLYTMTNDEIISKYELDEKCIVSYDKSKYFGNVAFVTTENSIDDYFDYTSIRRENNLNKII